jgi:hypothetical protein
MSPKKKALADLIEFVGPLISERLAKEDELGPDWPDKPVRSRFHAYATTHEILE